MQRYYDPKQRRIRFRPVRLVRRLRLPGLAKPKRGAHTERPWRGVA